MARTPQRVGWFTLTVPEHYKHTWLASFVVTEAACTPPQRGEGCQTQSTPTQPLSTPTITNP